MENEETGNQPISKTSLNPNPESGQQNDFYQDIFAHDLPEIERVWQEIQIAKAEGKNFSIQSGISSSLKVPIPLSSIRKLVLHELDNMRSYGEGVEGNDENRDEHLGVATGISKEAAVLMSFLGEMLIERVLIRTMYYLPAEKTFRQRGNITKSSRPVNSNSSPNTNDLVITTQDIRRALLSEDTFDFLVQAGLAQPSEKHETVLDFESDTIDSPVSNSNESTSNNSNANDRTITVDPIEFGEDLPNRHRKPNLLHLGYWKIRTRTISGLEPSYLKPRSNLSKEMAASSPSTSSTVNTELKVSNGVHSPSSLFEGLMMKLDSNADRSHKSFTLWPENEDLETNHVEFLLKMLPATRSGTNDEEDDDAAFIAGRIQIGHVNILSIEGRCNRRDIGAGLPLHFEWNSIKVDDPISGETSPAVGWGSFQFQSSNIETYKLWKEEVAHGELDWLLNSNWATLSLDLHFNLGETGYSLHNHYLCTPIFAESIATTIASLSSTEQDSVS